MMRRRRSRSLSPEKIYELEQPKVSWRNVAGQFLTLEENVAKVQARLHGFGELVAAHKKRLTGEEASLSVEQVFGVARQFRADTTQYAESLEEVLDRLEQSNIAMSTALAEEEEEEEEGHQEDAAVVAAAEAPASGGEEPLQRSRARLRSLFVYNWLRFRQPHEAADVPPGSVESSSSHSDLGSGIGREKTKRKVGWLKSMKMRSLDGTPESQEGEVDEESRAVMEDKGESLGLTENRGAPDDRTSTSGNGGAGVPSSGDGGEESSSGNGVAGEPSNGDGGGSSSGNGGARVLCSWDGGEGSSNGIRGICVSDGGMDGVGITSSWDGEGGSSSGNGGVGGSTSGDGGAGGSSNGDERTGSEEPADQVGENQEVSPSKTSVTLYRSSASTSFHSVTSGEEADCEAEATTTPAASTTTDLSNGHSNGNGNGIAGGYTKDSGQSSGNSNGNGTNARVMQSTATQTDESWIAWGCVEVGDFNKESSWSVLHELCRQQGLLRLALQHHMERLERLRHARLHLLSQADPQRASWLLREQLHAALRTVTAEVVATQLSLRLRATVLRNLADAVWQGRPVIPPLPDTSPEQLVDTPATSTAPTRPPRGNVIQRAFRFLRRFTRRH